MVPDAVSASFVKARCATEYKISSLERSDSIATLRAASHKYSDWMFKTNSNYTDN